MLQKSLFIPLGYKESGWTNLYCSLVYFQLLFDGRSQVTDSCEGGDIVHSVDLPLKEGEGEKATGEASNAEALENAGVCFQKRVTPSVDDIEED